MCKGFRKHIRVWALCLATLFAAYYATTALFTHVHVVNGVMLVHSHPFSHSHSHSDGQTLALHFLSTFSSLEPGHTEVETPDLHLLYSLPYIKNYCCPIKILRSYKIRADFICEVSPFSLDFSRQTIKSNYGQKYTF